MSVRYFDQSPDNARDWIFAHRKLFIWGATYPPFVLVPQIGSPIMFTIMLGVVCLLGYSQYRARHRYILGRYYFYREENIPTPLKNNEEYATRSSTIVRCTFVYYDEFVEAKMREPNLISVHDIHERKKDFDEEFDKLKQYESVHDAWKMKQSGHDECSHSRFNWRRMVGKIFLKITEYLLKALRALGWVPPKKELYYDY